MQDLDLKTLNGDLNIEMRTDGGIGIFYSTNDVTLQLSKDQLIKLMGWLMTYLEGQRNSKAGC